MPAKTFAIVDATADGDPLPIVAAGESAPRLMPVDLALAIELAAGSLRCGRGSLRRSEEALRRAVRGKIASHRLVPEIEASAC